jgi:AbrB family looped-hinge helix DNA binding protein
MSSSVSTVSEKGLVVIPKEIRKKYGLKKGSKVSFVDWGGAIYMIPALKDPIHDARGMFKANSDPSMTELLLEERHQTRGEEEREVKRWGAGSSAFKK